MELRTTPEDAVPTLHVVAVVYDGEPIFSDNGRAMEPRAAKITYIAPDGVWVPKIMTFYGFRLRGDGRVGKTSDEVTYRLDRDVPDWVLKAAAYYLPAGSVPMPRVSSVVVSVRGRSGD